MTRSGWRDLQNWKVQSGGGLPTFVTDDAMRTTPPRLRTCFARCLVAACALALLPAALQAHRVSSVSLISYLNTEEKTYVLDAAMEVVPSEEQELNDQISPEDAAREFAQDYLVIMFDQQDQKPEMKIEIVDSSDEDTPEELRRQQVLTKLTGKIPDGAKEFLLYLDPRCPMAVVMVVIKDEQPSRRMQVILAGEYSRPVSVAPIVEGDPFAGEKSDAAKSDAAKSDAAKSDAAGETPASSPAVATAQEPENGSAAPPQGRGKAAFLAGWRSFLQGSWLPWLLTVGIFLLTLGRRTVFTQIAVLLVTQSLVVALAAWKLIPVPAWAPTVLVLVIAVICGEALFHRHVRAWRLPLVAAGGLLAGFDLAGSLPFTTLFGKNDAGTGEVIFYLLGTESALVLVALVSAAVLLPLSRFEWYRRSVVQPVAIVLTGFAIFAGVEKYL
jgi:hypothetical protein